MYFIGFSTNSQDRFKASSGGLGTALTRYLLSTPEYGTSLTFYFNKTNKMYEPEIIYNENKLNVCGSIYQDINVYSFVKSNLKKIRKGIVLSCPPCQVKPIKKLLDKNSIPNFIISFCCSGQETVEGTWKYYELLKINKSNVIGLQYRGNGWPSGIQISLDDGSLIRKDNYTDPWKTLHKAGFYKPKKCFYCSFGASSLSDICLADPWLKEYIINDHIGHTLFFCNTEKGKRIIEKMRKENLVSYEKTDYNTFFIAQKSNIEKSNRLKKQERTTIWRLKLMRVRWYRDFFTKNLYRMKLYLFIWEKINNISSMWNFFNYFSRRVKSFCNKMRFWELSRKIGSHKGIFSVMGGVTMRNPSHIHIGNKVGIGENAFFYPVVYYKGQTYNPSIVIGDGTWIGKGCSIAAINLVEIGKNVLFAGHVHITDHSHGYEDISKPINGQPLITKGPVVIGDDCWLGFACEILSGVTIGKHSIIGARAVVTHDVPPYTIVAGNPAKIIKQYNFGTKKWERIKQS